MTLWALIQVSGAARAPGRFTHQFLPPARAYIGDAFALSEDGAQLAYVTTIGARDAMVHLVDLTGPE